MIKFILASCVSLIIFSGCSSAENDERSTTALSTGKVASALCTPPPIIGVFRGPNTTFNPYSSNEWLLRNSPSGGNPDSTYYYNYGGAVPIFGDWVSSQLGDGTYAPPGAQFNNTSSGFWSFRHTVGTGTAFTTFYYGAAGDIPVVGDWDGNFSTTIGVFRPAGTQYNQTNADQWLLRNELSAGTADIQLSYGAAGDIPVVGDWDGNTTTTIGVVRPPFTGDNHTSSYVWYLHNLPANPDVTFSYGTSGDIPVVGDWDQNNTTTIGVFRPAGTPFNQTTSDQWLLRNTNSGGNPDLNFYYGAPGDQPAVAAPPAYECF